MILMLMRPTLCSRRSASRRSARSSWETMVKKRKNLPPEELERLRAEIDGIRGEIRALIALLQARLDAAG